ncbi:uridine kinase [Kineococcus xinjiangensis]|uniref:Uridine kinase n=1 Tax=Kineococcus xinjiangensis TaxID=512762 RepID=A0A2S6IP80_9ACTN|nr:uridine kinase [Kineococcus xinjiangensis]PPK96062.1 uridine kinase [Kineococcus xinjiangensis]
MRDVVLRPVGAGGPSTPGPGAEGLPRAGAPVTAEALAALVAAHPPRAGGTRVVAVDGPSGSGKTTLAAALAPLLGGAQVVHMDELYPGWDGLADAVPLLLEWVLRPLAQRRPAAYRRYDWVAGRHAEEHPVPAAATLLLEGVGCGARACAPHLSALLWLEAPPELRHARGIARDGEAYAPHWHRWRRQEELHFAAEGTRGRADVRLDTGGPGGSADPVLRLLP